MNLSELKNTLKSIALLDAIICPEWEYRYFSYDSKWSDDEEMASMRDGQGNTWFLVFKNDSLFYKCISKEDGILDEYEEIKKQIPRKYDFFINESAFHIDIASSIWIFDQGEWMNYGKEVISHIIDLGAIRNWDSSKYKEWADSYYEKNFNLESIDYIFANHLNDEIIKDLNSDLSSIKDIESDLKEINYKILT